MDLSTTLTPPPGSFESLPPELRDEVYKLLLVSAKPYQLTTLLFKWSLGIHPAILLVNKKISGEALNILYGLNMFLIRSATINFGRPTRFSHSIPTVNIATIRAITIKSDLHSLLVDLKLHFSRLQKNCPRLKILTVEATAKMGFRFAEHLITSYVEKCGEYRAFHCFSGVDVGQNQWDELRELGDRALGTAEETAPLAKYILGLVLEQGVNMLPNLKTLELAGLLDRTMGTAAMEILKKRTGVVGKETSKTCR